VIIPLRRPASASVFLSSTTFSSRGGEETTCSEKLLKDFADSGVCLTPHACYRNRSAQVCEARAPPARTCLGRAHAYRLRPETFEKDNSYTHPVTLNKVCARSLDVLPCYYI
jgi:hypothetical protein